MGAFDAPPERITLLPAFSACEARSFSRIALIFAMEGEAAPFCNTLALSPEPFPTSLGTLPFRAFKGRRGGKEIFVTCNGKDPRFNVDQIGTEPAAVNAFATIQAFRPLLVISCGTVGATAECGAQMGDVFLSGDRFYFHDHRIPLPGWREFGLGGYASYDTRDLAEKCGLRRETLSTRNSLDPNPTDMQRLHENQAHLEDMESAAIAWVCHFSQTPFFAIKAVTNLLSASVPSHTEFEANFALATQSLCAATVRVIDALP